MDIWATASPKQRTLDDWLTHSDHIKPTTPRMGFSISLAAAMTLSRDGCLLSPMRSQASTDVDDCRNFAGKRN
ncbi:hypothetical protein BN2475_1480003 [Paraburkholderia ribeironis]|uniref:Uncharacterized protein n=1 Tax=Paraburkholderia ribeironis TaxID=1247936 RepID=A0A1N7SQ63_9BURK|nr:hypothetical protein BN2475_1480003 [Paraburkholderia ribeironis]